MKYFLSIIVLVLLMSCNKTEPGLEYNLIETINNYRIEKKLEPIPESEALNIVAQAHIDDLINYYSINDSCNLHTWSENGNWTSCCYNSTHTMADCMWDKPKELTWYKSAGYEIAAYSSGEMTADLALSLWIESQGHHNLIINKDIWKDVKWKAMGAAIKDGYAVVWFGELTDKGN